MQKARIACALSFCISFTVISSNYFEPRTSAMGGTSVASSKSNVSYLYNPALLTKSDEKDISINLGLSIESYNVEGTYKITQDAVNAFDDAEKAYDNLDSDALLQSSKDLESALVELDNSNNSKINPSFFTGFEFKVKDISAAFFFGSYLSTNLIANVSQSDLDTLEIIIESLESNNPVPTVPKQITLDSTATILGALVTEAGVSFAKDFSIKEQKFSVGISPKYQKIDSLNYLVSIDEYSFDNILEDQYLTSSYSPNLDIGLSYQLSERSTLGFSGLNLIKADIKTVNSLNNPNGFEYIVPTRYSIGYAWQIPIATIAIDYDLNTTKQFKDVGVDQEYIKLGAEYNPLKILPIRAGYKINRDNEDYNVYTAGIGLYLGNNFEINLAGNFNSKEYAAASFGISAFF